MTNRQRYQFDDFTRDNFRRLLRLGSKSYVTRTFRQLPADERFLVWRHDVDFSLHAAARIARIEREEDVTATYFLRLDSEFYNLFEGEVLRCAREIVRLGHDIGLHFDAGALSIEDEGQLEEPLRRQAGIVADLIEHEVTTFSFHNTSAFTEGCRRWEYGGLVNAYAEYFASSAGYCSDSNGFWRVRRLEDVLVTASDARLQVLIHPEWWTDTVLSPRQRVERCIEGRATHTREWYAALLKEHGRENVDWE